MIDIITGIDPRLKPTNSIDAGLSAVGKQLNWKINKVITQLMFILSLSKFLQKKYPRIKEPS
jgi:hypothetical protein